MIFINTALHVEARPFINLYGLKLGPVYGKLRVYTGNDIVLAVSGTGKMKSAITTAAILGRMGDRSNVLSVNIGICGASAKIQKGELLLVNKITDTGTGRVYYPDIVLKHDITEMELSTFDKPVLDGNDNIEGLVDMEAAGFWEASNAFLSPSQILIFKIVSDHMNGEFITKGEVSKLISKKVMKIAGLLGSWNTMLKDMHQDLITNSERVLLSTLSNTLQLTVTQQRQLEKMGIYYKLRTQNSLNILKPYLDGEKINKYQRNRIFSDIKNILIQS